MSEKTPQFWRDPQLPFVEARAIADGRQVCYSLHSHEFFSIGAITGGVSTYVNGERRMQVSAGDLVVINPQQAHACNPIADRRWSYIMFYLDLAWLGALQQELLGGDGDRFVPFSQPLSRDPALFHGLNRLYALLTDPLCCALEKQIAMVEYFSALQLGLGDVRQPETPAHTRLEAAAAFIDAHCTRPLTLDDICRAAALSLLT